MLVDDVVALLLEATRGGAEALKYSPRTLNMGGPERLSRVDMAKLVCQHRGWAPTGVARYAQRAVFDIMDWQVSRGTNEQVIARRTGPSTGLQKPARHLDGFFTSRPPAMGPASPASGNSRSIRRDNRF